MKPKRWLSGAVATLLAAALACGGCSHVKRQIRSVGEAPVSVSDRPSAEGARVRPDWLAQGHPRLMLNGGQIRSFRTNLSPQQQRMWQELSRDIDGLKRSRAPRHGPFNRGHGNRMAQLAVMAKLSDDPQLVQVATDYLLEVSRREVWDPDTDLLHGHMLWGAAIAYDWLWQDLSPPQRDLVRTRLGLEAQRQYEASTAGRGYWRNQYLQNHGHVNFCGLAFAAGALYGEDGRAPRWLTLADDFFSETFCWSNPDGTSIEGLSYGMYALEFCLRYAELVRQMEGVDCSGCPWLANMPLFVIHSTLPVMTDNEWAMDFGDSPRNANSHLPTHSMAYLAARRRDPLAQGVGAMLRDLQGGLGRDPWQTLLWYDPQVPAADLRQLPTFHHFTDTGQVMMRTDWSTEAMLVGLRCGPWLGHRAWRRAGQDLGAAHEHPDINSFQVFAGGEWLLIDPGYTYRKRTSDHSTLLIDGIGQLGENATWFAAEDATRYDHYARIVRTESTEQYDYVMGDATGTYHPGLGLTRFVRHWLLLKPSQTLVVVDDIAAARTGYYKAWTRENVRSASLEPEHPNREFLVPRSSDHRGKVWFVHDGPSGTFDLDVDYFDNAPGAGHYAVAVADRVVARWTHNVPETDLHVRTIHGVQVRKGDRVELRGEPFGRPGKFIKMVLSSRTAPRDEPHRIQLLLHAPVSARVAPADAGSENAVACCVDAGGALLDIWSSGPQMGSSCGEYAVVQGSRIKKTRRVVLTPVLERAGDEDAAVAVTVLRPRTPGRDDRCRLEAKADAADRSVRVRGTDPSGTWDARIWLEDGQLRVQQR